MNGLKECEFCGSEHKDYYTCPRCNSFYCSSRCYRSPLHSRCSEEFYKQCVEGEMRLLPREKRFNLGEAFKGGIDDANEVAIDSDDDDVEDLSDRLEGVDLEDSETVWAKMTECEKTEFQALVKSGEINRMLPEFKPWWDFLFRDSKAEKIVDVEEQRKREEDFSTQVRQRCPKVDGSCIQKVSSLLARGRQPSPVVKFGLLNTLYSYAFSHRLYRGEIPDENLQDFVELCLSVSGNLGPKAENFHSAEMALESGVSAACSRAEFGSSREFAKTCKKDVFKIVCGSGLAGEENFYILSALFDMLRITKRYLRFAEGDSSGLRRHARRIVKKLEFYISWSNDFYEEFAK